MRYVGGAVGHTSTSDASRLLGRRTRAYADKFAREREAEISNLRPQQKEPRVLDEQDDDSDRSSTLDDGAREQSDDSDYVEKARSENDDDDCAYDWSYPEVQSNTVIEVEGDGEEELRENEIQAYGYRDD